MTQQKRNKRGEENRQTNGLSPLCVCVCVMFFLTMFLHHQSLIRSRRDLPVDKNERLWTIEKKKKMPLTLWPAPELCIEGSKSRSSGT